MSKYNVELLQSIIDRFNRQWWIEARKIFGDKIGVMPSARINTRLTSAAGRAFITEGYSDFSAFLLTNNQYTFRTDTVPHELAHHIAWRLYKDKGHGPAWKDVALKLYGANNRCHNMRTLAQMRKGK